MRKHSLMIAVLALAGLVAGDLAAHGGTYSGPAGGGAPGYSGPTGGGGGSTPGGNGGCGGTTPGGAGGGGGATPGGGARPPGATGGAPGGRAPGGLRGGATPSARPRPSDLREWDWDFWWELNDDRYLNLKSKVRSREAATASGDTVLGERGDQPVAKVNANNIRRDILPTLRNGARDSFFDARAGAVIALGKVIDAAAAEDIGLIKKLLGDTDQIVRESACLALGLVGSKDEVPLLLSMAKNEPAARQLCNLGTRDISSRQRAFAMAGVGFVGSRMPLDASVVTEMIGLMKSKQASLDLQVFPAMALGIMQAPAAVPELQKLVADAEADPFARAHAAVSLGKLGDKSSVPFLVKDVLMDKKSNHIQRSAAISLGLLTDKTDDKTVEALITASKEAADRATRNFCLIALGEIGNVKGRDYLLTQLMKGQAHDRTFSALALGIYGFKHNESKSEIGAQILEKWNTTRNDAERGAYAIGLGLLDYKAGAPALLEELKANGSPELKGYVAIALGLIGEKTAIPFIQEQCKQKADLDAQRKASIALGLIQDPDAIKVLQGVIAGAENNLSTLGAASLGLGFIGDRSAIATLADILNNKDGKAKDNARAFAAVSLGILGDKDELAILTKLQGSCNYLAQTEALKELLLIY